MMKFLAVLRMLRVWWLGGEEPDLSGMRARFVDAIRAQRTRKYDEAG